MPLITDEEIKKSGNGQKTWGWSSDMNNPNAVRFAHINYSSAYISDLRNRIGYYTGWISEDYSDQVTADNAWDLITDDVQVAHCMDLLSLWSAGEYVEVIATNSEIGFITSKALSRIADFTHARKSLIYSGTLFGLGLQEITWRKVRFKEYPGLVWTVPVKLQEVDRRRLRIERSVHTKQEAWWTIWDYKHDQYVVMVDKYKWPDYEGPALQDYIWYFWEEAELAPLYRGKGAILYRLLYIKDKLLKYWARLAENWSTPYVTFFINTMKELLTGNTGQVGLNTLQGRLDDIIGKYQKMVAGHVMVLDKDAADIKFSEHGMSGENIISGFINYIDDKIIDFCLAAKLTTQSGSTGSYAHATIHKGASQSKVIYGRHRGEERFEQDLVWNFYYRNVSNFDVLDLEMPEPGEVKLAFKVRSEEIKEQVLLKTGIESKKTKMAETL